MTISIHLYFLSVSHHTSLFFPVFFFLCFISHCFLHSVCFFTVFPSVSHPSSHPLTPVSTAPAPAHAIPIYPRSCVVFLCICLKIGLGRETFSCENHKSVRLILLIKGKHLWGQRSVGTIKLAYIFNNNDLHAQCTDFEPKRKRNHFWGQSSRWR